MKEIYNETEGTLNLESVDITFTVAEIYRGVDFEN